MVCGVSISLFYGFFLSFFAVLQRFLHRFYKIEFCRGFSLFLQRNLYIGAPVVLAVRPAFFLDRDEILIEDSELVEGQNVLVLQKAI